jgi:hypothetical protein
MPKSTNNLTGADGAGRIPSDVAQQLIETYKTQEGWAEDKTRAVWFSIADLADIVDLVTGYNGDGARIYFAKYPLDTDIPGTPDPSYKGMVTLVFIPTLAGPEGSHQDLFPATPPASVVVAAGTAVFSAATGGGDQGYNHGELCPPC